MIDAVHDGGIDILAARRRDHDLLRAALQMGACLGAAREEAGALENEFGADLTPRQLRRIALREHADAIAVDDHRIALDAYFPREPAVHRVVARQVRIGLRVTQIIDGDDLDLAGALGVVQSAQNVAADAAVAVDSNLDWHMRPQPFSSSSCFETILSGVKPKWGNRSEALPEAPKRSMPITRPCKPT